MRWKFQYSLSSILWFTLCAALVLSSVLMYRRMTKAERNEEAYRRAAWSLVVGDERLVHGLRCKTDEPYTWRWQLYLPPDHGYRVKVAAGVTPAEGLPATPGEEYSIGTDGELALEAVARRVKDEEWSVTLSYRTHWEDLDEGCYRREAQAIGVARLSMKEFADCGWVNSFGDSGIEVGAAGQPVVLLRDRFWERQADGSWKRGGEPSPGFMIWLEEKN